jgi:ribosomal-protein-alanine N-acetyltransferase
VADVAGVAHARKRAYVAAVELHSPWCTVRSYRPEDAPHIARHGTNRKVWLNLRDRFPHPFTEADGAEYIGRVLRNADHTSFAIEADGAAIGGISLHIGTDIERLGAELGYWIGEDYWGRGIATAAIALVTAYGFSDVGLTRVFAVPFTKNIASWRALEKAGYTREGTLRKSAIKDGHMQDQYMYATVRD